MSSARPPRPYNHANLGPHPGTRLGPYEILEAIGAGMGEMYRAHDTRLDRDAAIKILPEVYAADAERVAWLQREAEVLASLNHPTSAPRSSSVSWPRGAAASGKGRRCRRGAWPCALARSSTNPSPRCSWVSVSSGRSDGAGLTCSRTHDAPTPIAIAARPPARWPDNHGAR